MLAGDLVGPEKKVIMNVDPGACRLYSQVIGWADDDGMLGVQITSECKSVVEFGKRLQPMDVMEALRIPYCENLVFVEGGKT